MRIAELLHRPEEHVRSTEFSVVLSCGVSTLLLHMLLPRFRVADPRCGQVRGRSAEARPMELGWQVLSQRFHAPSPKPRGLDRNPLPPHHHWHPPPSLLLSCFTILCLFASYTSRYLYPRVDLTGGEMQLHRYNAVFV